ncbi:MAG: hypothetical protein NTV34_12780 [Proteobacteria bacterium]|nr:hypothetical protein [Pseudomonadota bacterium]
MNSEKSRSHHGDRVVLTEKSLEKVTGWIDSIAPRLKGAKVTRADLVNWLISNQGGELTVDQQAEIEQYFFDPIKAVAWVTGEIQRRQKSGEEFDVQEFIHASLMAGPKTFSKSKVRSLKNQSNKLASLGMESSNGKVATKDS